MFLRAKRHINLQVGASTYRFIHCHSQRSEWQFSDLYYYHLYKGESVSHKVCAEQTKRQPKAKRAQRATYSLAAAVAKRDSAKEYKMKTLSLLKQKTDSYTPQYIQRVKIDIFTLARDVAFFRPPWMQAECMGEFPHAIGMPIPEISRQNLYLQ